MPMNGPKALSATNAIAMSIMTIARVRPGWWAMPSSRRSFGAERTTSPTVDAEEPKSPQSSTLTEVVMHPTHLLAVLATERLRVQAQETAVEVHQARFGTGANAARPRRTSDASRSSSAVAAAAPDAVSR